MVGVPRSQGCRTCRRKKKGCDLERPVCGQCARLSTTCTWDERRWTFKAHDTALPGPSSANDDTPSSFVPLPPLDLRQSLDRTAVRHQVEGEFWAAYLPGGRYFSRSSANLVVAAPTTPTLRFLASQDDTVRFALDACTFMTLGRLRGDESLSRQGKVFYGVALRGTNRALQHPIHARADGTLAACRLLSMCEIFRGGDSGQAISTQGSAWQSHAEGIVRVLEFRGPRAHVTEHGHALFQAARLNCAIAGLTARRSAALSSARWLTLPWSGMARTLTDELVDVLVSVTCRLQEQEDFLESSADVSRKDAGSFAQRGQAVLRLCMQTSDSLMLWEAKALSRCTTPAHLKEPDPPRDLEAVCKLHGFGFFHLVMQYWAACIIHYSRTWLLCRRIGPTPPHPTNPGTRAGTCPTPIPDPQRYSAAIARNCSHYFEPPSAIGPGGGLLGAQAAAFPMGGALHYYAATGQIGSAEMGELRRVLRGGRLAGFTSGFLRSLATADPVPAGIRGDVSDKQAHSRIAANYFGVDGSREAGRSSGSAAGRHKSSDSEVPSSRGSVGSEDIVG
ncbi:hypothetical protein LTR53_004234 [Teratosphaeriaceae sp. CCFEE 6253]|nr:hypothetical protein LTR53_004234 [Teratosphaeriaceae sp. CCFEE 6253]